MESSINSRSADFRLAVGPGLYMDWLMMFPWPLLEVANLKRCRESDFFNVDNSLNKQVVLRRNNLLARVAEIDTKMPFNSINLMAHQIYVQRKWWWPRLRVASFIETTLSAWAITEPNWYKSPPNIIKTNTSSSSLSSRTSSHSLPVLIKFTRSRHLSGLPPTEFCFVIFSGPTDLRQKK